MILEEVRGRCEVLQRPDCYLFVSWSRWKTDSGFVIVFADSDAATTACRTRVNLMRDLREMSVMDFCARLKGGGAGTRLLLSYPSSHFANLG